MTLDPIRECPDCGKKLVALWSRVAGEDEPAAMRIYCGACSYSAHRGRTLVDNGPDENLTYGEEKWLRDDRAVGHEGAGPE